MVGNLVVSLVIPAELLLPFCCGLDREPARQSAFHPVCSGKREFFSSMTEVESVRCSESTFGHGKVIYRIEEIGLSLTVVSAYTVDIGRELQFLKPYVPEIGNDYFFKYRHNTAYYLGKYND